MAGRFAVDKGSPFSTKHKRPIRQRLRQMRKLIPNTYLMRIYDANGRYIRTTLVQLSDVDEELECYETEGQETCETQSEGTTESYEDHS